MTGTLIFIIVVVSVFGGVVLTAFAVFLYFFYQSIKRLTVVAEAVHKIVQPLAAGNSLTELLRAFQSNSKVGKGIVTGLASITATVAEFNRYYRGQMSAAGAAIAQPETAATADAIDFNNADSFFIKPTEEEAAQREVEAELRKVGVETNPEAWPGGEPPLHAQVGEQS